MQSAVSRLTATSQVPKAAPRSTCWMGMRDVEPWFGATTATSDTRSQLAQFQNLEDPWVSPGDCSSHQACHPRAPCQWEPRPLFQQVHHEGCEATVQITRCGVTFCTLAPTLTRPRPSWRGLRKKHCKKPPERVKRHHSVTMPHKLQSGDTQCQLEAPSLQILFRIAFR